MDEIEEFKKEIEDNIKLIEMSSEIIKEITKDFIRIGKIHDDYLKLAKDPMNYILDENLFEKLEKKTAEMEVCTFMICNKLSAWSEFMGSEEEEE